MRYLEHFESEVIFEAVGDERGTVPGQPVTADVQLPDVLVRFDGLSERQSAVIAESIP